MTVKDIVDRMVNGSVKVLIWESETGEVILQTIWYNLIDEHTLNREVEMIYVREYEMRLGVK